MGDDVNTKLAKVVDGSARDLLRDLMTRVEALEEKAANAKVEVEKAILPKPQTKATSTPAKPSA